MKRSLVSVWVLLCVLSSLAASSAAAGPIEIGWAAKFARRAGAPAASLAPPDSPSAPDVPHSFEGTWRALGNFASGGSDIALFTFGAGSDSQGIVLHSDNLFLVAAPSCLTAQGVWKKTGDRKFTATDEAFCFDSTNGFAPAGTLRFRTAFTVDRGWATFTGNLHLDAFDVDGNLVFTDDATVAGTRMAVVAPPSP